MAARVKVDWDAMEPVYSAGIISLKELGIKYGCSDVAIIKHARKARWTRDLAAKIRVLADRKVSEAMVSEEVRAKKTLTENIVKEAVASTQAEIRTSHMVRSAANRLVVEKMISELDMQADAREDLAKLGELMMNPEVSFDKLNDTYHKIISFAGRVDGVKKLIESWCRIAEAERKFADIDKPDTGGDGKWTVTISKEDAEL